MRIRRLHKKPAALEITAFLNLIVVLVPFLLSTAVFSRMAIVNLSLPAQSAAVAKLKPDMKLELVIRADAVEVQDQNGGLIQHIPDLAAHQIDAGTLSALLLQIKQRFPDKTDAAVLAEANTPYDRLIAVMDAVREQVNTQSKRVERTALFPDISVGDAPGAASKTGQGKK
jgi:biopolymer transport protein ExbD